MSVYGEVADVIRRNVPIMAPASVIKYWEVFPVQAPDGIGAGLQSVAVPGLAACILNGTGRVNVGQGAVMTVQGVGAALGPAIGGWLAQDLGYPGAFMTLGCFAVGSIIIWLCSPPCLNRRTRESEPVTALQFQFRRPNR